jgi:hypothetical protein
MIAPLTYPTLVESAAFPERAGTDSFSHRVLELHRIIADRTSKAVDVKSAKRSLLRTLKNSKILERSVARGFRRIAINRAAAGLRSDQGGVGTIASSSHEGAR